MNIDETDKKVLSVCLRLTQKNKRITRLSVWMVRRASALFFLLYLSGGLWLVYTRDARLLRYIGVPLCCLVIGYGIRQTVKRRRPYDRYGYPLAEGVRRPKGGSFPSNHALSAMVIALALWFAVCAPVGAGAFVLALLTGFSRICVGVHHPSDVAAGWLWGLAFGAVGFCL